MLCPYCHNENKDDALTCDYCLKELPLDEDRKKRIKKNQKLEKKNRYHNSMIKLIGTILGILAFVIVILIVFLKRRG